MIKQTDCVRLMYNVQMYISRAEANVYVWVCVWSSLQLQEYGEKFSLLWRRGV